MEHALTTDHDDTTPDQCIVFDEECRKAPFWLRLRIPNGIDIVELHDANGPVMSLPAAVQACVRLGYDPTHSITARSAPYPIPNSIVRRPGSSPRENPGDLT